MLVLKGKQRAMLVDKLPDVANLALGALVFGQFLRDDPYSLEVATVGVAIWAVVMAGAAILAGGAES